jgi:Protein of unknown function (DUF3147).
MRIHVDKSGLKATRWHELAVRFILGGLITAATGIIGKKYGPGIGGLFLAFPAIFPSSATLIEKHEREKKQRAGVNGEKRARRLVAVDATGAAMGSIGLLAFALLVSELIPSYSPSMVIVAATLLWMAVSTLIWYLRKRI